MNKLIKYIFFVKIIFLYIKIYKNFITLAFDYNQLGSMKKGSCLDKNNNTIPWYTYQAIEYLQNLDFTEKNVFEYSGGNSYFWWKERCRNIISIESNKK
jgi:hypothetical protein